MNSVCVEFVNRCTIENVENVKGIQTDTCRKILIKLSYIFKRNKLKIRIGYLNVLNNGRSRAVIFFLLLRTFRNEFLFVIGVFGCPQNISPTFIKS